jgi:hypothetical protein
MPVDASRTKKPRRWARNVAIGAAAFALLRLVVPGVGQVEAAVMLFVISMVCAVVYFRSKPRADEDESREWTDTDKEKFKRLMDAQRRNGSR